MTWPPRFLPPGWQADRFPVGPLDGMLAVGPGGPVLAVRVRGRPVQTDAGAWRINHRAVPAEESAEVVRAFRWAASHLLSGRCGRYVEVRVVTVVDRRARLSIVSPPVGFQVVPAHRLRGWLSDLPATWTGAEKTALLGHVRAVAESSAAGVQPTQ